MQDKWLKLYGLPISPLIMGGAIFNYIDWSWGWDIPHFHTWAFFLYVLTAVSLSSVWNDLLWGFWWNRSQTTYINPLDQSPEWNFQFFGQTLFTVTSAIMFWSIIARISTALTLITLKTKYTKTHIL